MQEVIESIIGKEMTKSLMGIIDELIVIEADEKEELRIKLAENSGLKWV